MISVSSISQVIASFENIYPKKSIKTDESYVMESKESLVHGLFKVWSRKLILKNGP